MADEVKFTAKVIDVPWTLPNGWDWTVLDDVGSISAGSSAPQDEKYFEDGTVPFVKAKDVGNFGRTTSLMETEKLLNFAAIQELNLPITPKGTILLPKSGASVLTNNRAITDVDAVIVSHLAIITPNHNEWDTRYVYYWLCIIDMRNYVDNLNYPSLKIDTIKAIHIPKPPSITVQHQIVDRIEASLSMSEESHKVLYQMLQDAEPIMAGALKEVAAKLDRDCPNSPALGSLILSNMVRMVGGSTPPKNDKRYWAGSIPWVTPKDMKQWYIGDTQDYVSSLALKDNQVKTVAEKSVLVVVRGMILARRIPVGITTVEATINQDIKAFQAISNIVPEYLGYVLLARAPQLLHQVDPTGNAGLRLTMDVLKEVIVPNASCNLQKKVVVHLDAVQESVNKVQDILKTDEKLLRQVERAVLERAFKGDI